MSVCVSIVSHNRADELRRTLPVIAALDPQPDEVRIVLDRCSDDSAAVVQDLLPRALLSHSDAGGSVPNRDAILRTTTCDFVLSLDDDSYPVDADALARAHRLMERFPRCGVLAWQQISDEFPDRQPDRSAPLRRIASFVNCGAFLRRAAYLKAGGYTVFFGHAYEEPDLTLRLLDQGYTVIDAPDLVVRHHYSTLERSEWRTHCQHARNGLWSMLMRAPGGRLPVETARMVFSQAAYAKQRGWLLREPRWWGPALRGLPQAWQARKPVRSETFAEWRRLLHHPETFSAD